MFYPKTVKKIMHELEFHTGDYLCIMDPVKFFRSLRQDIEAGSGGPRARTRGFQRDLQSLKNYFNC